jgi:hypothetical protein
MGAFRRLIQRNELCQRIALNDETRRVLARSLLGDNQSLSRVRSSILPYTSPNSEIYLEGNGVGQTRYSWFQEPHSPEPNYPQLVA